MVEMREGEWKRASHEEEWNESKKEKKRGRDLEGTDLSSSNLSPGLLGSHHRMDRHRQRTGRWM